MWAAGISFRHAQRSMIVLRTQLSMRFQFFRRRQHGASEDRVAFRWRAPCITLATDRAMSLLWNLWHKHSRAAGRALQYLIFDTNTRFSFSSSAFVQAIREVAIMSNAIGAPSAGLLAPYSFKRGTVRLLEMWQAPSKLRWALLGLRDDVPVDPLREEKSAAVDLMPSRYDGRKSDQEEWVKLYQLGIVSHQFEKDWSRRPATVSLSTPFVHGQTRPKGNQGWNRLLQSSQPICSPSLREYAR